MRRHCEPRAPRPIYRQYGILNRIGDRGLAKAEGCRPRRLKHWRAYYRHRLGSVILSADLPEVWPPFS